MSLIESKIKNAHLQLYALSFPPANQQKDTPLKRLGQLAKTRRFDDILAASALANYPFPSLTKSITLINQKLHKQGNKAKKLNQPWDLAMSWTKLNIWRNYQKDKTLTSSKSTQNMRRYSS